MEESKVKFTGIDDSMIEDIRTYLFENDDYRAKVKIGFIDEDAPVDPDMATQTVIKPKKDSVAKHILHANVMRTNIIGGEVWGNPSIGDNPFDLDKYLDINESWGERMMAAKRFVEGLDEEVRVMFPGYGIIHRDGDKLVENRRAVFENEVEPKKDAYYKHKKKYSLYDLLVESFGEFESQPTN